MLTPKPLRDLVIVEGNLESLVEGAKTGWGKVLAVGTDCCEIEVGDQVCFSRYAGNPIAWEPGAIGTILYEKEIYAKRVQPVPYTCGCTASQDCTHPYPMTLMPDVIQAGDTVKFRPSDEAWHLLGVDRSRVMVCVAGWPPTSAKLADCTLIKKGTGITLFEDRYRRATFGDSWE